MNKKYQIIYADPPWSYKGKMQDKRRKDGIRGVMKWKII